MLRPFEFPVLLFQSLNTNGSYGPAVGNVS